jgi:bifunctional oligoribonuclease and PAP phosphatase NrnA
MNKIIQALKASGHILLVSHVNPDGDALGSMIAMGVSLKRLGVETTLFNESPIPDHYHFLAETRRIVREPGDFKKYGAVVALDCGDLDRTGRWAREIGRIPVVINIDHHATNDGFGDFSLVDPGACATAELVFRLLKKMGAPISRQAAEAIYMGIVTDTGSFRFSNTNRAAFDICGEMTALGADPFKVGKHIYRTYSLARIRLLGIVLDSIEMFHDGKVSLMTLTRDMIQKAGAGPGDMDGLIDYARGIQGVKAAVLIKEMGDGPRRHVSMRSDGDVDVAALASRFGGGGHPQAAAFDMDEDTAHVKSRVLDLFGHIRI